MEIEKEGLCIYNVVDSVQNEYFLSVEYFMICYNQPQTLLPIKLREQNGKRTLLYDISDGKTLKDITDGKNLQEADCRDFLRDLYKLLEEIEELMLNPGSILFLPDTVYRMSDGHYRWMYCPDEQNELTEAVREFIAWMLSAINYGDSDTVRFIYHVYWSVRNRNLSLQLIEDCLCCDEEKKCSNQAVPYEAFFAENQEGQEEIRKESQLGQKQGSGQKSKLPEENKKTYESSFSKNVNRGWMALSVFIMVMFFVDVVVSIIFFIGIIKERNNIYLRYITGCVIIGVLLLDSWYQVHKKRRAVVMEKENGRSGIKDKKSMITADNTNSEENYWQEEWENSQEGKTEILNVNAGQMPMGAALMNKMTGEVCPIQVFPFYIGNDTGLNQLMIHDKTVSRRHAVIDRGSESGSYCIRDLQSTNGTWINESRMGNEEVVLSNSDLIRFAGATYMFEVENER